MNEAMDECMAAENIGEGIFTQLNKIVVIIYRNNSYVCNKKYKSVISAGEIDMMLLTMNTKALCAMACANEKINAVCVICATPD